MHAILSEKGQPLLQMPMDQFREVITSRFMDELMVRAKAASKLPFDIAAPVVHVLYGTYSEADRIYQLRGAKTDYQPQIEEIEKYANVALARAKKLDDTVTEIETYLCTTKGISRFMDS